MELIYEIDTSAPSLRWRKIILLNIFELNTLFPPDSIKKNYINLNILTTDKARWELLILSLFLKSWQTEWKLRRRDQLTEVLST